MNSLGGKKFAVFDRFINLDLAVLQANDSFGVCCDLVFMGDHNDRASFVIEPLKEGHDFIRRHRIEIACRFVGKDKIGIVHQRAGNRHPLLLTTGQLGGPVAESITESHHGGQHLAPFARLGGQPSHVVQWDFDIFYDAQLWDEIVGLKHKPDSGGSDSRQFIVGHLGNIIVAEHERTFGRADRGNQADLAKYSFPNRKGP